MNNKIVLLALISTCLSVAVLAQVSCCFDPDNTLIPFKAFSGSTLTNADCRSYCKEANYYWAGTQNGNECWCGNDICYYGQVDSATSCTASCAGNTAEKCGAFKINTLTPTNARYLGCYVDGDPRDLWSYAYKVSYPSYCRAVCNDRAFSYYSIQNGDECYCSTGYGRYGPAPESDCKPCANSNLEKCGGPWRNSVYKVW